MIFEAQDSIMMIFLRNMVITYQFDVLLNNFKFKKMKMINNNWFQSKNGGKHKLKVKFSYVVIVYQLWNNVITLNALFTPCPINILFVFGLKENKNCLPINL